MVDIESRKEGRILVITVGEHRLDSPVAPDFQSWVNDWINKGEIFILLDLSQVSFVDSTGLGAIVSCLKHLKTINTKGDLWLAGISLQVMSLFKLTRMDRVFTIFPDQATALREL